MANQEGPFITTGYELYGKVIDHKDEQNREVAANIFAFLKNNGLIFIKFTSFMRTVKIHQNERIFTVIFQGQEPIRLSLARKGNLNFIYPEESITNIDNSLTNEVNPSPDNLDGIEHSKGWKRIQKGNQTSEEA